MPARRYSFIKPRLVGCGLTTPAGQGSIVIALVELTDIAGINRGWNFCTLPRVEAGQLQQMRKYQFPES